LTSKLPSIRGYPPIIKHSNWKSAFIDDFHIKASIDRRFR
jgi:hypothetical protein